MTLCSSVRRILKRGGGGGRNFRKFERNIDQNLKLSHSNFVLFFAQNQVKSKKKGLHSNFVPFFAQYQVISSPKPDAQLAKGEGHASILLTLLCNVAILATQRGGGHGPMAPPPNYAPDVVEASAKYPQPRKNWNR